MSRGELSPEVSSFLGRLNGVRSNGVGWSARCPCRNDDDNPSLSIGQGTDGRVLVTCHRGNGCSVDQICEALEIKLTDLMPAPITAPAGKLKLVETYDYRDADGTLLFQKQRFIDSATGKKTFRQRKPDGKGGWIHALGDTPKVLYNLPAVTTAIANDDPVWVVEGEKDANALIELGYVATTMPGGAGKWLDIHTTVLAGGRVGVISDADEVGRDHAAHVLDALKKAGCRTRGFLPCGTFKDIAEMLGAGKGIADLLDFSTETTNVDTSPVNVSTSDDPFIEVIEAITGLLDKDKLSLSQKVTRAHSILDSALFDTPVAPLQAVNWFDFVNEDADDGYDWVIPGLLERTDRIIFVAPEGAGKTMLARQVAILSAWGVHPFTKAKIPRIKTLTIDLENPTRIIRRKSKSIMDAAAKLARERTKPEANIVIKPSGLNLLKSEDRQRFEQVVELHRPDLLFIGPLYKAFIDPGGRSSESVATELILFLDYIRETYGCAMWMEQHAPLGSNGAGRDLRPFGSAVWSRWPEFGLAMERDVTAGAANVFNVKSFRGDRDERHWPEVMKWGETLPFEVLQFRSVS